MILHFSHVLLLIFTVYIASNEAVNQNETDSSAEWDENEALEDEEKEESQIIGAPSELLVMATHDSVQVSWLPPRDDNVLIRGYLIGWGINIPDVEKATVEPEARHFTIRGLKPNREYVISLRAFNKIGHGFPIYETVKTSSYGVHSSKSASISDPKSTFGGFGGQQQPPSNSNGLSAPVGVVAETVSSSQIRLSWIDPNENAFNQMYTIKYGISNSDESQHKQLNITETEQIFEGLRPDTLYEFAVRLAQSSHWSLNALNRTHPAPPSSPPRDLTIIGPQFNNQHENADPGTITLTWQPPKYANGEIQEYIVLYSDRPHLPDRDWIMDSVKGDRLSIELRNLRPRLTYHFKLQARNVKGYGPFTPVTSFTTADTFTSNPTSNGPRNSVHAGSNSEAFEILMSQFLSGLRSNLVFVLIGIVVAVVVLLLFIALCSLCFYHNKNSASSTAAAANRPQQRSKKEQRNKRSKHHQQAYIPGRKMSVSTPSAVAELDDDLWLVHQQRNSAANSGGARFATIVNASNVDGYGSSVDDETGILLIDGQQRAFFAPANAAAGPNFQSTQMECVTPKHYQQNAYHAAAQRHVDSVETLPRGHSNRYHLHNSSASLEMNSAPQPLHIHQQQHQQQQVGQQQHLGGTPMTPRNAHVVYTRVDRQPIAKMDFTVGGSAMSNGVVGPPHDSPHNLQQRHQFSGTVSVQRAGGTSPLPPPPSLTAANRGTTTANAQQYNRNDSDGYQTVGGRANAGGAAMLSFVNGTTADGDDGNGRNCDATGHGVTSAGEQHQQQAAKHQQQRMAHIVRPIVYVGGGGGVAGGASPSPSTIRSAAGQSQTQKTTPTSVHKFAYNNNGAKVPVGRAMVQPRVNLAVPSSNAITTPYACSSSSSQYASVRVNPSNAGSVSNNAIIENDESEVKTAGSTKDLQEIDQMIETLHQLQHDFTGDDNASAF
ncbi:hypothetical protein niasHT_030783 [Heterodera trifolii]|uniref:Fibronectin type-III domain-containing protein n=1 Tax=Heterodera trifolii TaxID=157864 RepID=A0ABD2HT07_9BILA